MTTLSRISMQILDEQGLVEVLGDGRPTAGVLPDVPARLQWGASVRIWVNASALDALDVRTLVPRTGRDQDAVELRGRLCPMGAQDTGRMARFEAGLIFGMDVDELRALAELDQVAYRSAAASYEQLKMAGPSGVDTLPTRSMRLADISDPGRTKSSAEREPVRASTRARDATASSAEPATARSAPASLTEEGAIVITQERNLHTHMPLPPELDVQSETPRTSSEPARRFKREDTEPSGMFGSLREMPLVELMQSLEMARKTAAVSLQPKDGPAGEVFLHQGRVVCAETADLQGEDAFFALAQSTRGAFRVRFHESAPRENIDRPTAFLLLEVHRRADEAGRDRHQEKTAASAHSSASATPSVVASAPETPKPESPGIVVEDAPDFVPLEHTLTDMPAASDDDVSTQMGSPSPQPKRSRRRARGSGAQIGDDATTAAERKYPTPRAVRHASQEPSTRTATSPTSPKPFSHFFDEVSGEGDSQEDDLDRSCVA